MESKMSLTLNEYQQKAKQTAVHPGSDDGYANVSALVYLTLGLNGEAGEAGEVIKKMLRDSGGVLTPEIALKFKKELGDVLWYLARVTEVAGFTLEEIAEGNLEKLGS